MVEGLQPSADHLKTTSAESPEQPQNIGNNPKDHYAQLTNCRFVIGREYTKQEVDEAPTFTEKVIPYLELKTPPFTELEIRYIELITRNIGLVISPVFTHKLETGRWFYDGPTTRIVGLDMEALRNLRYPEVEFGIQDSRSFEEIMGAIYMEDARKKPQLAIVSGFVSLMRGNPIERTLSGKGTCLDFALTGAILAKAMYPYDVREIQILPYSFPRPGNENATLLGHEHYGLYFRDENWEEYLMMFGGLTIPVKVLLDRSMDELEGDSRVKHRRARDYLRKKMKKSTEPDSKKVTEEVADKDIEEALANMLALSRALREFKKSRA
jgi:hypothetical protein